MFGFLTKKKSTNKRSGNVAVNMDAMSCHCGCIFSLASAHIQALRDHGAVFYCPNGHQLSYGVSDGENVNVKLNEASEEITKLKRQNLKLIHDREQMETKLSEGKNKE
jgi:hypothetical protein